MTQFDQADITDLEAFRVAQKAVAEKAGVKLTVLPCLKARICSSCRTSTVRWRQAARRSFIKYVHIGFAVDTPDGLLVRSSKRVKSLLQLAAEAAALAARPATSSPGRRHGARASPSPASGTLALWLRQSSTRRKWRSKVFPNFLQRCRTSKRFSRLVTHCRCPTITRV